MISTKEPSHADLIIEVQANETANEHSFHAIYAKLDPTAVIAAKQGCIISQLGARCHLYIILWHILVGGELSTGNFYDGLLWEIKTSCEK